ncbi:hypothetical protein BASA81_008570 [Batrachochytrium salamandrivorans]|nr:hypothetical protein BASA81_008570 [Batrachochytrium salamandrivorans]
MTSSALRQSPTNQSVRNELLDIFEDLTDIIDDGTYLRALNLLAKIDVDTHPVIHVSHEDFDELFDRLDGIGRPLGSRVIGVNFLVTRPGLIFPILDQEQRDFLLHKFETNSAWRRLINKECAYIFDKENMRFVMRTSRKGKQVEKRCKLEQFPELYMVNPRTGRLVFRQGAIGQASRFIATN